MSFEFISFSDVSLRDQAKNEEILSEIAAEAHTRDLLMRRGYYRVISRHTSPEKSSESLKKTRSEIEKGNLRAWYIMESKLGLSGVAAAVQGNVARRTRLHLMPGALVRRTDHPPSFLHLPEVIQKKLSRKDIVKGPQLAAWAAAGINQYSALNPAFSKLRYESPGTPDLPAWVFEAGDNANVSLEARRAISDAGFYPKPENADGFWDDGELRFALVRRGTLYIANTALPHIPPASS